MGKKQYIGDTINRSIVINRIQLTLCTMIY